MGKIIPEIDRRGLREFGFVSATIIVLLFGVFFPVVIFDKPLPELPLVFKVSIGLAAVALMLPAILKPIYIVWMLIGFVLGWINNRILLGLVFYGLFTPVALFLKLFRVDPMRRKIDKDTISYKQSRSESSKQHMENPY